MFRILCISLVAAWASVRAGRADTPDAAGRAFFEKDIRPLLVKRCYECHSTAAKKRKGGLFLDSRAALRKGGSSGPAIVPGDPQRSLLIQAVHYNGLEMPPKKKGKLSEREIAALERWVRMGAPDPRTGVPPVASAWEEVLAQRRQWWSLQPVRNPALPAVGNGAWCSDPLDRLILARLEQHGLQPAADADRRTLMRRLSLVLTGLLPTPEDVEAFVRDPSPDAYRKLVDRLLASPHFGEKWTQHFFDVVRFSETHGKGDNYEVPHASTYRDYLVRAFNADVPYDRLIREHLAGDLLPPRWNPRERLNEAVIGTFFWRPGEVDHEDCIGFLDNGFDRADNQIDTLSKAFQATTVACARCHDHKIDAVSTRDYYRCLGIIRGSRQVMHTIDAPEVHAAPMQQLRQLKADMRKELGKVWLEESVALPRYLLAAQAQRSGQADAARLAAGLDRQRLEQWVAALKGEQTPSEAGMLKLVKRFSLTDTKVQLARTADDDPLAPWRVLAGSSSGEFRSRWQAQAKKLAQDAQERDSFNRRQFLVHADFTTGRDPGWRRDGHGLRAGPGRAGDFALNPEGETVVQSILPAGWFTHSLSSKLNGTLQSPVFSSRPRKYISFLVRGTHGSAVRLVANNCQLAYVNSRYLDSDEPHWVTIPLPEDPARFRAYVELMTVFDNPKFPDPSGGLAGDPSVDVRLPWEQAVRKFDRSYFGVSRVVMHDGPEVPRPPLRHLLPLFQGNQPARLAEWAQRHGAVVTAAVKAWIDDRAGEDDVRWLDYLVRHELLGNRAERTPGLQALVRAYRRVEQGLPRPRVIPGMADWGDGCDQPLFVRGDCTHPAAPVQRGYLEVLAPGKESFHGRGSGRLELANRIASADNPLTARVMVNRVWHHLFGTGIVATVDDFGRYGEQPTPADVQLLDHLSSRFVQEGWSIKRLIRTVVLSHTFRTQNRPAPRARQLDPRNRWLQHYPARMMEAEMVRDAMLAAAGRLERTLGGPSVEPFREKPDPQLRLFSGPLDGNGRRSLYVRRTLTAGDRFLEVFNATGGKVVLGRRDVTNVPAQALILMNGSLARSLAADWAHRRTAHADATVADRLDGMFRAALGRPPEVEERRQFESAIHAWSVDLPPRSDVLKNEAVWTIMAHTLFNLQEFVFIP